MNFPDSNPPKLSKVAGARELWLLAAACAVLVLIAIFLPRPAAYVPTLPTSANASATGVVESSSNGRLARTGRYRPSTETVPTADEIVAAKLNHFARIRRETVRAMARHFKVEVPAEVERFYDAAEAGRWEEMTAIFQALKEDRHTQTGSEFESFEKLWPAITETYGVAEAAHNWPAQKLLDYGQSVLGALRPDMVYVGGTDPGRFIPTLLNETTAGQRHIVVTQNAFADGSYLDYVRFLYSDRLATPTPEDSQSAFQDYLADARRRAEHDRDFPNEPKQLRPGEDIKITDNRIDVSGQVAVMAINEKLLQTMMQKNPDAAFAIETSFPFESMYADATTLGPIMELGVRDGQNALTPERAQQAVDYWRSIAQQAASDPEAGDSENFRKTYSKMAAEQAALLLNRNFPAEAEQAFRSAVEIHPSSPEAVFRYVNLLVGQNRINDAIPVAANALAADPQSGQVRDLLERLKSFPQN